jgi:hypothetical protein
MVLCYWFVQQFPLLLCPVFTRSICIIAWVTLPLLTAAEHSVIPPRLTYSLQVSLFGDKIVSQCSPCWPGILYIAQAGLELMILLPPPPKCWDYRCTPPHPDTFLSIDSEVASNVSTAFLWQTSTYTSPLWTAQKFVYLLVGLLQHRTCADLFSKHCPIAFRWLYQFIPSCCILTNTWHYPEDLPGCGHCSLWPSLSSLGRHSDFESLPIVPFWLVSLAWNESLFIICYPGLANGTRNLKPSSIILRTQPVFQN